MGDHSSLAFSNRSCIAISHLFATVMGVENQRRSERAFSTSRTLLCRT